MPKYDAVVIGAGNGGLAAMSCVNSEAPRTRVTAAKL